MPLGLPIQKKLKLDGKKMRVLVALGAAACVLLLLSELIPSTDKNQNDTKTENVAQTETKLEERLTAILSQVDGVGDVSVMITLEDEGETVYAADSKNAQKSTADTEESTQETQHILLGSGSTQSALVEQQNRPHIKGVAVVCTGGSDISVVRRITDIVSVVLGVSSNRVCVTK